jgi:tetratricopeptide (TPR) repeat protein
VVRKLLGHHRSSDPTRGELYFNMRQNEMKNYRNFLFFITFLFFLQIVAVSGADVKGGYFFSIHGASYREQEQAMTHILSVEKMGITAFSKEVNIPGKGLWHRVYIGKYDSLASAKKAANILQKKNVIDGVRLQRFTSADLPAATAAMNRKVEGPDAPVVASAVNKKVKGPDASAVNKKVKEPEVPVVTSTVNKKVKVPEVPARAYSENKKGVEAEGAPQLPGPSPLPGAGPEKRTPASAASPLDNARSAFKAERYPQAIELINVFIKEGKPDKVMHEAALRLMADSHYMIGTKGSPQSLLTAADQYKAILQSYPDPAAGNDSVYNNMATSYVKLKFFYEAAGAWDRLILLYPNSPFFPEAMYSVGDILYTANKYDRAADKLATYLKKYPDGKFAKMSHFTIGDCYYRTKKSEPAVKWFDEARKKWPDMIDIPQSVLENMGKSYMDTARFGDALQIFSLYASLYPATDVGKTAIYNAARAADEAGHASLAIKLYSLFINKHPEAKESDESALALANLGVSKPGMRVSHNVAQMDDYLEPLQTYNRLLSKDAAAGNMSERIMLLKAKALGKKGNIKDAITNYLDLLGKFPRGKYRQEALSSLKSHTFSQLNTYYSKGDHLAVSDLYFRVYGKVVLADDFETAFRTGYSLQTIGLYAEAKELYTALQGANRQNRERNNALTLALADLDVATKTPFVYQKPEEEATAYLNYGRSQLAKKMTQAARNNFLMALKDYQQRPDRYNNSVIKDIYIGLGDTYLSENKFSDGIAMYRQALPYASDAESKRWLMISIGQGYEKISDFSEAEKSFAGVKDAAEGEFWPKIADYFISESRRAAESGVKK